MVLCTIAKIDISAATTAPITPCLELNGGRSVSAGRTPRDSRAAVVAAV